MKPASLIVRYDGPALVGHRMDVADLAPALLGLSELCKIANAKFNGERAAVKVLIGADQDQKCFQFSIDVVQTLWQQAQALLDHKDVKSAKDILEWLGLVGGGSILGFFGLLKWYRGREIAGATFLTKEGKNVVQLNVDGDRNTVVVYQEAFELLKDDAAVENAKKVVRPVLQQGYDKVEFESDHHITEQIRKQEAAEIFSYTPDPLFEVELGEPQTITAYVRVYAPVYDKKADKWRFLFNGGHPYMDISETTIAEDAMRRGGALMNDLYKVKLEVQQYESSDGNISARYKIKEVLEFHPARMPHQPSLLDPDKE